MSSREDTTVRLGDLILMSYDAPMWMKSPHDGESVQFLKSAEIHILTWVTPLTNRTCGGWSETSFEFVLLSLQGDRRVHYVNLENGEHFWAPISLMNPGLTSSEHVVCIPGSAMFKFSPSVKIDASSFFAFRGFSQTRTGVLTTV